MPYEKSRLAMLLAIVVFVGGGCFAASNPLNAPPDPFALGDEIPIVSESTIDSLNLYGATVKVEARVFNPMKGHVETNCSGTGWSKTKSHSLQPRGSGGHHLE